MRTAVLITILTCGCISSTYSQINQKRKKDVPAKNHSSFHHDIKPALDYKKLIKPNGSWNEETIEGFFSNRGQYTDRVHEKAFVPNAMPCYKPEGVFSMRIVKPDSTIRYKMLIK